MFENIKPTDTTIEVALPFYIMSQISNIFYYANIKDKGLTMYDEKFGLALARKKLEIRSQYFDIQKTWHEKWITRYPDVPETDEYITHYRERYEAWTRGRAERKMNDTKNTLNFLKVGIAKGEITLEDIILNEDYRVAYILYNDQIKKVFESKASADSLLTGLQNRQERGDDDE